jgi:hypothetical protein
MSVLTRFINVLKRSRQYYIYCLPCCIEGALGILKRLLLINICESVLAMPPVLSGICAIVHVERGCMIMICRTYLNSQVHVQICNRTSIFIADTTK